MKRDLKRRLSEPDGFVSKFLVVQPRPTVPLDTKIERLLRAIHCQKGIRGRLILIDTGKSERATLQSSLSRIDGKLSIQKNKNRHALFIDNEYITSDVFRNYSTARKKLCAKAVEILKKNCFYIKKKEPVYEPIQIDNVKVVNETEKQEEVEEEEEPQILQGSKAHQMMLKMGWSAGKGLGSNEQGSVKLVQVKSCYDRNGIGSNDRSHCLEDIKKILEEFAKSSKTTTLTFDTSYTKQERSNIHRIATKLNLKSLSTGARECRRLTISKKVTDCHSLIDKLLRCGLEDDNYILEIPSRFDYLFNSDKIS